MTGPGDVFTYMTDSGGSVINRYVDTRSGSSNTIPIAASAHVHTNWIFTAEGDYFMTVTPSMSTVAHGTITGPSANYHFRVGPEGTGSGNGNGNGNGSPGGVTPASFTDVGPGHLFVTEIGWLGGTGITRGCNPPTNDRFCPNDNVTRGQMAAFIGRALAD